MGAGGAGRRPGRCEAARRGRPAESGRSGSGSGSGSRSRSLARSLAPRSLTARRPALALPTLGGRGGRSGAAHRACPECESRGRGWPRTHGSARGAAAGAGGVGASAFSEQPGKRRRRRRRPGEGPPEFGSGGGRREGRARSPPPPFSFPPFCSPPPPGSPPPPLLPLLSRLLLPLPLALSSSSSPSSLIFSPLRSRRSAWPSAAPSPRTGRRSVRPARMLTLRSHTQQLPLLHLSGPTGISRARCPGFISRYQFEVSPG